MSKKSLLAGTNLKCIGIQCYFTTKLFQYLPQARISCLPRVYIIFAVNCSPLIQSFHSVGDAGFEPVLLYPQLSHLLTLY